MAPPATKKQVCIKILVDKEKNKVLFAQAGNDFVDVLLSFLTLPLGTIARLVSKDSNMPKVNVGSISSLYESMASLEEKQFWTGVYKEMLLQPRNPMEDYCQNLKLNIDDTEKSKYFICEDWQCSRQSSGGLLSTFSNQRCKCGKLMNQEIFRSTLPANEKIGKEGFVLETMNFIILDNLSVIPDDFQSTICLPKHLGCDDFDAVKEVTLNVTQNEILDLLKCSFLSATPLTDLFLLKKQFHENAQPVRSLDIGNGDFEANGEGKTIQVKVILRKSNNTILFALGTEDFADFVLSFLTFPLGGVVNMLNGNSSMGSIDNLYKGILDLDCNIYLRSPDLKDKLVKSRLAHQFKFQNQILPIDEESPLSYYCITNYNYRNDMHSGYLTTLKNIPKTSDTYEICAPLSYLEPQSSNGEAYSKAGRGFIKRTSLFMVTDDLVVTPASSASTISFLTKLKIPQSDLEERVISIGKKEGLSLMKASLISSSVLTNGLGPFLKIKNENIPN